MKKAMNKILAVLMAVAMLCAMAVPAFAAGETGTITINNAVKGQTYTIYKIFDLNSYDKANNKYSYTVAPDWKAFFAAGKPGANYITLTNGHPEWIKGDENSGDPAAFAKAALAWAQDPDNNITKTNSVTASGAKVNFTGLDLGYYLVDSSLGALCSLNTTNPNAKIEEKNEVPEVDKKIKENGDSKESNTAQINDVVNYEVTVTAKKGTTGYVVRDTMSAGLTFNNNIKVTIDNKEVTAGKDTYTLTPNPTDCTFELKFNDDYILGLVEKSDTSKVEIKINYTATINENAEVGTNKNTNTAILKYGHDSSIEKKTTTNVYEFDLVKVDGKTNKLLKDAEFKLYKVAENGDAIKLYKVNEYAYRVATAAEIEADTHIVDTIVTKGDKVITISGLAGKKYYLEETKAPDGYNALPKREEIDLTEGSKKVTELEGDIWTTDNGGVYIENNAGATLPSTGGMGTTLFYVIGGGLMIAAVVLLVTKKRMENK